MIWRSRRLSEAGDGGARREGGDRRERAGTAGCVGEKRRRKRLGLSCAALDLPKCHPSCRQDVFGLVTIFYHYGFVNDV